MKFSDKDLKELLPEFNITKEHSLAKYLPLFSAAITLGFTTASILICFILSGFVRLSQLPTAKASLWSSGVLIASLPGFLSVWAFHYLAWNKLSEAQYKLWVFFSCCSGMLSQTSLTLLGLSPSEAPWLSDSVLEIEDQAVLSCFLVSSLVFACFSFRLSLALSGKQPRTLGSAPVVKVVLVAMMMALALAQGLLSLYSRVSQKWDLRLINDIIQYICFYLHMLYFSSLYIDLSEVKFSINLTEDYQDSAFASAF